VGAGADQRGGLSRLVLVDNEAVQALASPRHPQHRRVVSHAQVVAHRKRRGALLTVAVPTTVRVEAGWDRAAPAWALANHLRIRDLVLDAPSANVAAAIRQRAQVSVADAHLGVAMRAATQDRVTVLTSDPEDMRRVAGSRDIAVAVI
jgi:hypothetical protein